MIDRKDLAIVVLVGFFLAVALYPRTTSSVKEYDPWLDTNDDGKIRVDDILAVALAFGADGTSLTKAAIEYDSGWVDITDKAGQYFNITHDLNSTDVIVDITGKTTLNGGVHQRHLGGTGYTSGWSRTYGGTNDDYLGCVIHTSDGGYALAGYTKSSGSGGSDMWLVKTDAFGNVQWNKTYGRANDDEACSVVQTSDGGYALGGTTKSFGHAEGDMWLVKVDQYGNEQWNKTYAGINQKGDIMHSMAYTSDEGFIMAGDAIHSVSPWCKSWLVKTNSTGDVEWDKKYVDDSRARSVIEISHSNYVVAGYRYIVAGVQTDMMLFKTDENGTMLWHKNYGGSNFDAAYCLVETSDGGYVLVGHTMSFSIGGYDFWLVKTNSTGDKEWDKTYGGTDYDMAYSVVQTSDGGYAIAGHTESFGAGDYDAWLIKTDASGNHLWNRTYGGASNDYGHSVVQTGDRGYALACSTSSFGAGGRDGWLVKTGVESGLAWTDSTADTITLYRGATDPYWNYVRVRIWKIKETP